MVFGPRLRVLDALELALKLKEACYVAASGLSYADLLHGPIAVIDAVTPALLVAAADGPVLPGMTALAQRVTDWGATRTASGATPASPRPAARRCGRPRSPSTSLRWR